MLMMCESRAGCEKCHDLLHRCCTQPGNLGSRLVSGLRGGGRHETKIWQNIQKDQLLDDLTAIMGALEERERRHQAGIPEEDTSSTEMPETQSESSALSSAPSHPDDLEHHGPVVFPDFDPKVTPYNHIVMYEVWPGTGEVPLEGQTLKIRWNVARRWVDLLQPSGLAEAKPWKGDSKFMGGSWVPPLPLSLLLSFTPTSTRFLAEGIPPLNRVI